MPGKAGLIDVDALQSSLSNRRASFESWALARVRTADALKERTVRDVQLCKDELKALEARREAVQQQSQALRQRLAQEQGQEAALQAELDTVQAKKEDLSVAIEQLQQLLSRDEKLLQQKEGDLSNVGSMKRKKLAKVQTAVDLYRTRFGLEFVQPGDGEEDLHIVMKQINPEDPGQQFSLAVRVLECNQYKVTKCQPTVADLQQLLDTLNTTNNFGNFVRCLRKQFQQTCN